MSNPLCNLFVEQNPGQGFDMDSVSQWAFEQLTGEVGKDANHLLRRMKMTELDIYAKELLNRLRECVESGRENKNERIVPLIDLLGAIQLIQSGAKNLEDVERMNWCQMQHPVGAIVHHAIDHQVVGSGIGARSAIDNSIRHNSKGE